MSSGGRSLAPYARRLAQSGRSSSLSRVGTADATGRALLGDEAPGVALITLCNEEDYMNAEAAARGRRSRGALFPSASDRIVVEWGRSLSATPSEDGEEDGAYSQAEGATVRIFAEEGEWSYARSINIGAVATSRRYLLIVGDCHAELSADILEIHKVPTVNSYYYSSEGAGALFIRRSDYWLVNGMDERIPSVPAHAAMKNLVDRLQALHMARLAFEPGAIISPPVRLHAASAMTLAGSPLCASIPLPAPAIAILVDILLAELDLWTPQSSSSRIAVSSIDSTSESSRNAEGLEETVAVRLTERAPGFAASFDAETLKNARMLAIHLALASVHITGLSLNGKGLAELVELYALLSSMANGRLLLVVQAEGDLAGRLAAVGSAVAIAAKTNRHAHLIWPLSPGVPLLTDLFNVH